MTMAVIADTFSVSLLRITSMTANTTEIVAMSAEATFGLRPEPVEARRLQGEKQL